MLLRCRSRDRENKKTPPGPVYMSNEEFAEYLKNLRNNRIARPRGARPLLSQSQMETTNRNSFNTAQEKSQTKSLSLPSEITPRSSGVFSHGRKSASISTVHPTEKLSSGCIKKSIQFSKPSELIPSATYIERGQRRMEKEEAIALREAMEDMDPYEKAEEERIFAAAQKEASELVWQHRNSESTVKLEQPYRYKNNLGKNSHQHVRIESVGRQDRILPTVNSQKDTPTKIANISENSGTSEDISTRRSRVSIDSSYDVDNEQNHHENTVEERSFDSFESTNNLELRSKVWKSYQNVTRCSQNSSQLKRRNSEKRNISGELISSPFSGDQIWEEPEQSSIERGRQLSIRDIPAPLRIRPKNPLNRVQFAQDVELRSCSTPPEPTKKLSIYEIHKNPPSQTRNPTYISNPLPEKLYGLSKERGAKPQTQGKDGLEMRSDEIKQATSMRLKDRSHKLPIPSVVSNKPGCPIVSFDSNWKPKEADMKSELRSHLFKNTEQDKNTEQEQCLSTKQLPTTSTVSLSAKFSSNRSPTELNGLSTVPLRPKKDNPGLESHMPLEYLPHLISSPGKFNSTEIPSISATTHNVPVISVDNSETKSKRPLPVPKSSAIYSTSPKNIKTHWSLAAGKRATVTCLQCRLPIQNRVLKIGASEHFHPECFCCSTCGTELESLEIYPEPSSKRMERIDRIRRRVKGEKVPEIEGQTQFDDGDEQPRYYCHLDFHENFAPKCKHCKTPIIGEHIVALGEHWHHGHFFCAECGDPFDKDTTHIQKDGYAWCLNCQTKRTERRAPKCKKCKKSVIGEYVQALGSEWHDKCFHCEICKGGFHDGTYYPKKVGDETIVLCIQCIERELKV